MSTFSPKRDIDHDNIWHLTYINKISVWPISTFHQQYFSWGHALQNLTERGFPFLCKGHNLYSLIFGNYTMFGFLVRSPLWNVTTKMLCCQRKRGRMTFWGTWFLGISPYSYFLHFRESSVSLRTIPKSVDSVWKVLHHHTNPWRLIGNLIGRD